jgi:FkbM family methyltransferase
MGSNERHPLSWRLRVAVTQLRNRIAYVLRAPLVYRNWWAMALPKLGTDTVLELRSGSRYFVRARTLDLGVINDAAFQDPYLASGYVTVPQDATVVDVGANIGDFAVRAATLCPRGKVIAVEPMAFYGQMIDTQARLNSLRNITWIAAALSGESGTSRVGEVGGVYSQHDGAADPVRTMTLEQLIQECGLTRIDLLKLDCEGAEWGILPAADRVLPLVRQISMEFHCLHGWTPDKLAHWLRARGFEVTHTGGSANGLLWARRPPPRLSEPA